MYIHTGHAQYAKIRINIDNANFQIPGNAGNGNGGWW